MHVVAEFEGYFRGLRRVFHHDPAAMRTLAEEIQIQRMVLSDHDNRHLKYRHYVLDAVRVCFEPRHKLFLPQLAVVQ